MTIRKGHEWGISVDRPADLVGLASDAAVAAHVGDTPVSPTAGDLYLTLGAPDPNRSVMQRLEVDAIRVVLDEGTERWAIAHVIARRSWWRGPVVAAMNVGQIGSWQVSTRAHPNDGLADVVEVDARMSVRDRWAARRRLPSGAHVPHPHVATRRVASDRWDFARPTRVWVDGVDVGRARRVAIDVVPDRYTVHV